MEEDTKQEETKESSQEKSPGSGSGQVDVKRMVAQLEALLDEYMVKKAPFSLPLGIKEFIVRVAPYLIVIFAIMSLPLILAALGLSAFFAPIAMITGHGWGFAAVIWLVTTISVLVMEIMAVPGLFKQKRIAWQLIFYAIIVSFIGSIFSIAGILGGIIGAIIGWYILFQVKDMYKN